MKLKQTVAIAAAAGALAAISVPAMAFENEFHGTSRLRYFLSNYENGGGGNPLATTAAGLVGLPAGNATENLKMNNYFEQRTRIFYTAKASDDLKLVTGFEIDSVFGDRSQSGTTPGAQVGQTTGGAFTTQQLANINGATGRNQGGGLESDTVNLETKWVYLDFKIPSTTTRVTAGIQPFKDQLKGIFMDFDGAGILTDTKAGPGSIRAGYFRGYDQSYFSTAATARPRGMDNLNIGVLEGKFAVSKDVNVGGVYYLYDDARGIFSSSDYQLHVVGLTADAKVGPITLSGFAAYQGGIFKNVTVAGVSGNSYVNALAYNVAAKAAVGPGTLRSALLFTSGNDLNASSGTSRHFTGWTGTSQSSNVSFSTTAGTSTYNESGMMLLNRNAAAGTGTTDTEIIYNTGNGTSPTNMQGAYLLTLGYDANLTPKMYLNGNVGAAWAAHSNALKPRDLATGARNASNYMGTEVNVETGYKMYDNLTASLSAAYVILGGYYAGSSTAGAVGAAKDPENPYTVRTSLIFNF